MKHFTRLFGLLVALFMFAVTANAQSVAINFGSTIATGHPDIFGMTGWPCNGSCKYDQVNFNYPGSVNMQQQMLSIGGSFVRSFLHTRQLVPNTTTARYRADLSAGCPAGSTCDPSHWTWDGPGNTDGQVTEQIKPAGGKLMLIIGEAANWDADAKGFPTDFVVYADINKKVFQHFNPDVVEAFPEPNTFGISPADYATVYKSIVQTIRSVNHSVPIGGPGVNTSCGGSDGSGCWPSYVAAMYASGAEVDYLSAHNYAGANFSLTMAHLAQEHGVPVYETEWNQDGATNAPANGDAADSVSFVGYMLAQMMNAGYRGSNYYSAHYFFDDSSLFAVGTPTAGNLLPKAAAWLLMARKLNLGAGDFSVKSASQNGLSAVVGAVNSAGQPVAVLVNDSASPKAGSLTLNGLGSNGSTSFQAYLADRAGHNAASPITGGNANVSGGAATLSFSMTAFSVEGVILGAGGGPPPTPGPSVTPTPGGATPTPAGRPSATPTPGGATPIPGVTPTPGGPSPTAAPTPVVLGGCANLGLISPVAGSTVTSPVTFASNFTGCSGWPGAAGFMRVEQTAPYPLHHDGAPGSPITVVTLAPGTYTVYPTFWSNPVTPAVRGAGAAITFTVGVSGSPVVPLTFEDLHSYLASAK